MPIIKPKTLLKPLNDFILSTSDFSVVHGPQLLVSGATKRVCVLDSSFNPPHLGHQALAVECFKHAYAADEKDRDKVLLLVLSVKNADKVTPEPAPFEDRLAMMCIMANNLASNYGLQVGVGLTKHARFVDKARSILNYFAKDNSLLKLTFAVGFDTLVRLFNPKYYLPDKLLSSLNDFIEATRIFCLTRHDALLSHQEQIEYVTKIRQNKFKDIPRHWANSIELREEKNSNITDISSSAIRRQIAAAAAADASALEQPRDANWGVEVLPEIKEYIIEHDLFK